MLTCKNWNFVVDEISMVDENSVVDKYSVVDKISAVDGISVVDRISVHWCWVDKNSVVDKFSGVDKTSVVDKISVVDENSGQIGRQNFSSRRNFWTWKWRDRRNFRGRQFWCLPTVLTLLSDY